MHHIIRIFKICGVIFLILFILMYVFFIRFSAPKSDDELRAFFDGVGQPVFVVKNRYKSFDYRVVAAQKTVDTSKTTMVFVHGAIGSAIDFKYYMSDSLLRSTFNMIAYDRVGYNYKSTLLAQKSLKFEIDVLRDVTKKMIPDKTILVGYSYGGPIVLGAKQAYKHLVLLAPAVSSTSEVVPFMVNFYKWKWTRWLVPHVWRSASVEKQTHARELEKYESYWNENPASIISIHGTSDGIVPYENSLFLQAQFPKKQFVLKSLDGVGHSLVWSQEQLIKNELLKLAY